MTERKSEDITFCDSDCRNVKCAYHRSKGVVRELFFRDAKFKNKSAGCRAYKSDKREVLHGE